MDKVFGSLKGLLKISNVVIDNNVFKLHYKVTVILLLACSILVTSRQYFGDPIECISRDDIPNKLLNVFCWIHATFSVENAWHKKVGEEIPYPGVDKYIPGENRRYHAYYQWVCFVLFLQAILFYLPRYFWKVCEGGKVKNIVLDLNSYIMSQEKKEENRRVLVEYLVENMGNHKFYAFSYFLCEVANFINVVGQMYLMDAFLGGTFSSYGHRVIQFTEWDYSVRYDPMIEVFPRLAKCTFHRYGSSGDVQRHDAMCILPINIINEKIYVGLWFWFIILAVLSALILVYHIIVYLWPQSRFFILKSRARLTRPDYLDIVLRKCTLSDWFVLDLLSKNLDDRNYRDLITDLARKLERKAIDVA
ncbi:innexin inx2 [Trichonephila clavata]|uniref:Innexin n=1 Tax=Trichonephila clavata TaxID=2740835 RepID=A0A8X6G7M9_TRICU|nr:innexin inx2 [Trichonephila clavata]